MRRVSSQFNRVTAGFIPSMVQPRIARLRSIINSTTTGVMTTGSCIVGKKR